MVFAAYLGISADRLTAALDGGVWEEWMQHQPVLTASRCFDDLERLDPHRADQSLGALIRLAQRGPHKELALLAVLHRVAPLAQRTAYELRDLSDEIDQLVVSELVIQILTTPSRRTHAHATWLRWSTRERVLRELLADKEYRRRIQPVHECPSVDDEAMDARGGDPSDNPREVSHRELSDLVAWAVSEHRISAADAAVIADLVEASERGDSTSGRTARGTCTTAAATRVARNYGVSVKTIRRRRDKALSLLRAAAADYKACAA